MKIRNILLAVAASSLLSQTAFGVGANITNVTAWADGDGAIVCPIYSWDNTSTVGIYGNQFWGPGHIRANVALDSENDPTLTLNNVIDNDTTFSWSSYQVNVSMNKPFTLSAVSVAVPGDWSVASVAQPGLPVGGLYYGSMLFTGGAPIAIGGSIDFTFKETFSGSVQTTLEFVPIPVPEPATFSLLLVGGLFLRTYSRRQK